MALHTGVFGGGASLVGTVANQNMDWPRNGTAANRLERPSVSNACRARERKCIHHNCENTIRAKFRARMVVRVHTWSGAMLACNAPADE